MMPDVGNVHLIGVLSDSHGNVDATRRAVKVLHDRGAQMFLHLGDIETTDVLDELVGHSARIVFGNCDYNDTELKRHALALDIMVEHPVGRLHIADQVIAYTHGHLTNAMNEAISDNVDWLLHGHTHEVRDDLDGSTRIINPGALFRASRYTVALLDLHQRDIDWIEIPKSSQTHTGRGDHTAENRTGHA